MAKFFFISDVHIGAGTETEENEKYSRLSSFFEYIKQPTNELFIVCDLFDFWFEYKFVVPGKYFKYLFAISKLIEAKVKIHFLPGNHDCWLRDFFRKELNFNIHKNFLSTEIENKKVYLFHGDGILKKDRSYRLLKKIFRNSLNVFLYRWIHPDLGIPLAKFMSISSREHTSNKTQDNTSEYINFAFEKFASGFDFVILAHTHTPMYKKFNNSVLLNLGDWINHFSYGKIENGNLSLNYWNG